MPVRRGLLVVAVIGVLVVAGCLGGGNNAPTTEGDDGAGPSTPPAGAASGPSPCQVDVDGLNAHAASGATFTFDVVNECDAGWTATDFAAFYGTSSSPTATRDGYAGACVPAGSVDEGRFTTACSFEEAGTYYLRAYAATVSDDGTTGEEAWSDEYIIKAYDPIDSPPLAGASVTNLQDVPSRPHVGSPFQVQLTFGWAVPPPGVETDEITVRWARESSVTGSLEAYQETCSMASGFVAGTYDITCAFATPGVYYLRGWARTGDVAPLDHWSRELALQVR